MSAGTALPIPFTRETFFNEHGQILTQNVREALKSMRPLPEDFIYTVFDQAISVLEAEPNVLHIPAPIIIAGDIHGQFYDLISMFAKYAELPKGRYLLLGDYVDRGNFSFESIFYLLCLKVRYPKNIFLLRGNHETRMMTVEFSFKDEVAKKYNMGIYSRFMTIFDYLPLAAVVGQKLFCVHAGISPDLKSIESLKAINRIREPQKNTIVHDMLWSDPHPNYDKDGVPSFAVNVERKCSYYYSYEDVTKFLEHNGLEAIVRSHSVESKGFRLFRKLQKSTLPSVFSIFSAPNYCGVCQNKAGVLYCDKEMRVSVIQFQATPEPYVLPQFMDLFDWITPIIGGHIVNMWQTIWKSIDHAGHKDVEDWDSKMDALAKICDKYAEMRQQRRECLDSPHRDPMQDGELSDEESAFVNDTEDPALFE